MGTPANLTFKHLMLALLTIIVWGVNFVAIRVGLKEYPPLLLSAVRFLLASIPWVFFLPRPKAPLKFIAGYGFFTFAVQFALLFGGIYLGLSPGLSSLVLQVQVFFSIGLAMLFFRERPNPRKIIGSMISCVGIGIVAAHVDQGGSFIGLICVLLAALAWATGNMFTKSVDAQSPLALVVWGNLVALPFMIVLSLAVEGPELVLSSLKHTSWETVGAVVYIVYLSTHIGYGIWGFLLKTYPTSTVVPFTLLIPIVGFLSSALFLGEDFTWWKLLASLFVMGGVVFNLMERDRKPVEVSST
jgi:O-acetylserine/cysteine efflux transporter